MNDKFIQVKGPFLANQDIIKYIKSIFNPNLKYIKKIGIQTKVKNMCNINGQVFEIGKTGILELNDVQITSMFFLQNESETTLIDCIFE